MTNKYITREQKVAQFVEAAGKKPWDGKLESIDLSVMECIREEWEEFQDAVHQYECHACLPSVRQQLCKEWADLQYVLSQAAWYYDIPADPSFNRVHESNMSKFVDGKAEFRSDGKILKGSNYKKPDMNGL